MEMDGLQLVAVRRHFDNSNDGVDALDAFDFHLKLKLLNGNAGWVVGQPNNWDNEQHCALYDANIRGRKTNGFKIAKRLYLGKDILTVSE